LTGDLTVVGATGPKYFKDSVNARVKMSMATLRPLTTTLVFWGTHWYRVCSVYNTVGFYFVCWWH